MKTRPVLVRCSLKNKDITQNTHFRRRKAPNQRPLIPSNKLEKKEQVKAIVSRRKGRIKIRMEINKIENKKNRKNKETKVVSLSSITIAKPLDKLIRKK